MAYLITLLTCAALVFPLPEMPNKLKKVYELEGLICDLHSHSSGTSQSVQLSKSQSTELLSTTVFDYEPGSK